MNKNGEKANNMNINDKIKKIIDKKEHDNNNYNDYIKNNNDIKINNIYFNKENNLNMHLDDKKNRNHRF